DRSRPLSSRVAFQLCAQPLSRGGVSARFPLSFDVAALRSGSIENEVRRLDQSRRLEFSQEITGADQAHAFVDDRAASLDIGVLEQQERFGLRIAAQKPVERLDRRLL